ncbi:MAG TPA: GTP cyclohydrolase I FolE [Dehalococcoidia bacterium]|jgi:GTP cyclohydrolase I|nr:GTP cyclohydrolase I FolE [Dehalococcoidia bacterium]
MQDELDTYRTEVEIPEASPELIANVHEMLRLLGQDPSRDGLVKTPSRVARSWAFLTSGYYIDPRDVVGDALFEAEYDEMVVVRDVEVYSLCEHHLLPFFGRVHIAYLPSEKIVGLSKLARLAEVYARRLQVQERLTTEIATAINDILEPRGVGVVMEAQHLCMMMRGVEKQESSAVTSCMLGRFRTDARTRQEFLSLIGK